MALNNTFELTLRETFEHQLQCSESCIASVGKIVAYTNAEDEISISRGSISDAFHFRSGHPNPIQCMCFGHSTIKLVLATACAKSIYIWRGVDNYFGSCDSIEGTGVQIGKDLGDVSYMSFSKDDVALAACIQREVWIINSISSELIATLTGHDGDVTAAEFCEHKLSLIITVSEDRTYKLWDLSKGEIIYKSSILSAYPFLCVAVNPLELTFACGSSEGRLRIFDLSSEKMLHDVDLLKAIDLFRLEARSKADVSGEVSKVISSDKKCQSRQLLEAEKEVEDSVQPGCSVLSIKYWHRSTNKVVECSSAPATEALQEDLLLVAGCSSAIVVMNANSMEILSIFDFAVPNFAFEVGPLSLIQTYAISVEGNDMTVLVAPIFSKYLYFFKLQDHSSLEGDHQQLTVLSNEPLLANSPLRSDLVKKLQNSVKESKKTEVRKKPPDKMNQKVVFNSKVKSSGYTSKPKTEMFRPQVNKKKSIPTEKNRVGPWGLGLASTSKREEKTYPVESEPPTKCIVDKQLSVKPSPITCMQFSGTGKSFACGFSDSLSLLVKLPDCEKSTSLAGHNGAISSVSFSHDNKWVLTAAADKTAKCWSPSMEEPLLNFTHLKRNIRSKDTIGNKSEENNEQFCKDVNRATFYYLDKFILLTYGNSLCLYKFNLDASKDDVKRYQTSNCYRLVKTLPIEDVQTINTFDAVNAFFSYVVLCACSDKSIVVFDMNKGSIVRTIKEAHSRPVNNIRQNKGSSTTSITPEAYDLFLTAAITDGVKLWDLRTNRCVRKFTSHSNRSHQVGLAYSPCSRFIAVGSEDRSTYIYDIRSSSYLHRLSHQKDVVSALDFHPHQPMLASATISGHVKLYSDVN